MKITVAMRAVQAVLRERRPELVAQLKPQFRRCQRAATCPPETGFCAAAADAVYRLAGGKRAGLKLKVARCGPTLTHWWVEDSRGRRYDPTAAQFEGRPIPYEYGRGCGLPTRKRGAATQPPSKLAAAIIAAVKE